MDRTNVVARHADPIFTVPPFGMQEPHRSWSVERFLPEPFFVLAWEFAAAWAGERLLLGAVLQEAVHTFLKKYRKNRDILISIDRGYFAGVTMRVAEMARWAAIFGSTSRDNEQGGGGGDSILGLIAMSIVTPLAAPIVQMVISRTREFATDETEARMNGDPLGLASALEKLGLASEKIPLDASPQTTHFFIVNLLSLGVRSCGCSARTRRWRSGSLGCRYCLGSELRPQTVHLSRV
jgi:hypothetical protein